MLCPKCSALSRRPSAFKVGLVGAGIGSGFDVEILKFDHRHCNINIAIITIIITIIALVIIITVTININSLLYFVASLILFTVFDFLSFLSTF